MTDREKAIVMAYTDYTMLAGDKVGIYYEYVREKLGLNALTHELAYQEVRDAIKEAAKEDFIAIAKADNGWISVDEKLPETGKHVLASCEIKILGGKKKRYTCVAMYAAEKSIVCSESGDVDSDYDEETDEYYLPEGWWECIHNWDEYSSVAIEDFVTHWMPLPEPPKEG